MFHFNIFYVARESVKREIINFSEREFKVWVNVSCGVISVDFDPINEQKRSSYSIVVNFLIKFAFLFGLSTETVLDRYLK